MKEFIFKYKFIIIGVAVLTTFLIGGTYAWVNLEIFGNKTNRVAAGTLSIELDESTCENISTTNAYPLSDEEGLKQVACTFSVENTGSLDSVYSVFLDDIELESGEERMPDSSMKYALKRNDNSPTIRTLDTTITDSERLLDSRRIKVGEKNTYELRFWIKEDAGVEAMNKVFYTNLRVVANLDTPKPVIETINEYYTLYSSSRITLSASFKAAVDGNTSFTDSKGNVWNPGEPLPNPGRTYNVTDSIEYDVTNMNDMFAFNKATVLDLSLWDTSNVTDMNDMFRYCEAESLNLSGFDTSSVTDMSDMFYSNKATFIDLSSFNTSSVTDMSDMFSYSKVDILDLKSFDTSKVTDMSNMFSYSFATTLDASGFDTSNVTNMSSMFRETDISTLNVSNFDTSNVTYMSSMFRETVAPTLDLSMWDTSNVTNMSTMFYYSDATIIDVNGFDTSKVTDMSSMFRGTKVTTLDVSEFDTSKVTDMSSMFRDTKVTTLDVSEFDTSNVTNMINMFMSSAANPIYVKDQAMLDRLVTDGSADSYRLQIK